MTVTIELPPDIEAGLLARAKSRGLGLPEYVAQVLREQLPPRDTSGLSPAERAAAWLESAKNLPHTPVLLDDSRESIYSDHD